jgi:hypothetical protein
VSRPILLSGERESLSSIPPALSQTAWLCPMVSQEFSPLVSPSPHPPLLLSRSKGSHGVLTQLSPVSYDPTRFVIPYPRIFTLQRSIDKEEEAVIEELTQAPKNERSERDQRKEEFAALQRTQDPDDAEVTTTIFYKKTYQM